MCLVPQHVSFHSFLHLLCPQKNYTSRQKHTPALRFQRRLSVPSFRFAPLRAISASHPRSTRYRLAPLTAASKESTSLRSAAFPLAFVRLKAALPARFSASPSHSPRPPTPKESGIAVIQQPCRAGFLIPQLIRLMCRVSNIYSIKRKIVSMRAEPNLFELCRMQPILFGRQIKRECKNNYVPGVSKGQALRVAFKKIFLLRSASKSIF